MTENIKEQRKREFDVSAKNLGGLFWEILSGINEYIKLDAREIRLRVSRPMQIYMGEKSVFISKNGIVSNSPEAAGNWIDKALIQKAVQSLTSYSLHTHQNELAEGFISTHGGGRAGIGASAVYENGRIKSVRDISSISLRVSREYYGCADELLDVVLKSGGVLLAGEPACGKTTILRELCRKLGNGTYGNIVLLDERMEIAAVNSGELSHDTGFCCDVLSGYKKADGMQQAVRTLSPRYVICDEIGGVEDIDALKNFVNSGVNMIATVHAADIDELLRKKGAVDMLSTGAFSAVAVMYSYSKDKIMGKIKKVYELDEINKMLAVRFNG